MAGKEVNRLYEFLANGHIDSEGILEAHIDQTRQRCHQAGEVYVLHDTTEFRFSGECRTGLGPVSGGHGFLGHVALAVSTSGCPLGALGFEHWVRSAVRPPKVAAQSKLQKYRDPHKESLRWPRMVETVEERLRGTGCVVVHVADRDSDDYVFIDQVKQPGRHFVIRIRSDRTLAPEPEQQPAKLFATMDALEGVMIRDVPVSKRSPNNRAPKALRTFPVRNARAATLHFSATEVTLQRPHAIGNHLPQTIKVNVVRVFEPDPPSGEPAVEWRLMTSEPIATAEDVARVVDIYRKRWLIEEFFKALKTGCGVEDRQLEDGHSLINATALMIPLACLLLLLRATARTSPDDDATTVIPAKRLEVLRAVSQTPLPPRPTVKQAMYAVAALAGHLKRNGDPGWRLLGQGYQRLLSHEQGWDAAMAAQRRAQSSRES